MLRLSSFVRPPSERRIHLVAWVLAVGFGLFQAWTHRYSMGIDGVSYIDIAVNLAQRDWSNAITGHWSPLFPATLAIALAIFHPGPHWEFPLVHFVELAIYIAALAAFTYFLAELLRLRDQDSAKSDRSMLPRMMLLALGYATFIWTTLSLITLFAVTPDVLLAGLVYLAAAMLVRIRRGVAGTWTWLLLGIVLGLGYLAKTVLFIVAPAFLVAAYFAASDRRAARSRVALATACWLAASLPWIALLSAEKDRFTIGDNGRDTYVWEVGDLPYRHWQGEEPGYGRPIHPTRLIHSDPPAYEFAEPIDGTYPVWYDPAYWFDGVRLQFSPKLQLLTIVRAVIVSLPLVDGFLLIWLMFYIAGIRRRTDLARPLTAYGFLLFPAAFALLLYTVVYLHARYIAGFWTLAFLALMLGVRLPRSDLTPRIFRAGVLAMVLVLVARLCSNALEDVRRAFDPPGDLPQPAAAALRSWGVEAGERVAWIGGDFKPAWARVARVQIIAEIPDEHTERFWSADEDTRREILERFAAAGADVAYATAVPAWAPKDGWTNVGSSSFARRLNKPGRSPAETRPTPSPPRSGSP